MDQKAKPESIRMWLMTNQKYFPTEKIEHIRNRLEDISESQFNNLFAIELKDPTTMLLVSIFLGSLGIDRFMLGDTGMGILKLLTGGLCGILTIIDWFTVTGKTKELNYTKLLSVI